MHAHTRLRLASTVLLATVLTCLISAYAIGKAQFIPGPAGQLGKRPTENQKSELTRNLVYFNDESIQRQLGCATAVRNDEQLNYTCFYRKASKAARLPSTPTVASLLAANSMCSAIYKPIPADYGRPCCVRQTKLDGALARVPAADKIHFSGTTLLMGRLSGPNPTHQLNIHFYFIYIWMKQTGIKMGELNLIIDCSESYDWIGPYGLGLAEAFGTLTFMQDLPKVSTFDKIRFSLPGGFPFDINYYETDKSLDCNFVELAWGVKHRYGIDSSQSADPKRIVVAQRRNTESRRMNNVSDLLVALMDRGFNATVVTFGDLSFADQLHAVSDAAVLVGVTGSDLVNLVFLPSNAAVVEVFPVVQGQQVFTPELWHLAQMTGKQHLKYVSPYNSTILANDKGEVSDRPVHQVNATDVHVPSLLALIESAALMAENSIRTRVTLEANEVSMKCTTANIEWYLRNFQEHL